MAEQETQTLEQTKESNELNRFAGFEPGSIVFPSRESESSGTDTKEAATSGGGEPGGQPKSESQPEAGTKPEDTGQDPGTEPKSDDPTPAKQEDAGASPKTDDGDGTAPEQQVDYSSWLKEKTGGLIADEKALSSVLEERNRLLEDSQKPKTPDFPNERAKKAYDFIVENKADFADAIQQYHHIMGIDVEKMSDRDIQREAFLLENAELENAGRYFDAKYAKTQKQLEDEDLEEDDKLLIELGSKNETKRARKYIMDMQGKLKTDAVSEFEHKDESVSGVSEEDVQKWSEDVGKVLNGFEKLEVSVGDQKVSLSVTEEDIKKVNGALNNPTAYWENNIAKSGENFSLSDYRDNITKVILFDKFMKQSYDNGFNNGQIHKLDEDKNLDLSKTTTTVPEPEKEETFQDAWKKAAKGKN